MLRLLLFPCYFGFLGSLIGKASNLLGSITGGDILGGLFSGFGQASANAASAKQAHQQMAFQRDMSGTAHQREVADLRAAGLNPILSGTGGAGSSTPGGAMAMQGNVGSAAFEGIASATAARRARQEARNLKATNMLIDEQTAETIARRQNIHQQTNIGYQDERERRAQADVAQIEAEWAHATRASRVASGVASALGAASNLLPFGRGRAAGTVIRRIAPRGRILSRPLR